MIKKLIKNIITKTLIATTMALSAVAVAPVMTVTAEAAMPVWQTTVNVNLRSSMNMNRRAFAVIPAKTVVKVLGVYGRGAWAKVEYKGSVGYIRSMFLEKAGTISDTPKTSKEGTDKNNTEAKTPNKNKTTLNFKNRTPVIVIDAGHGGVQPGAVVNGNKESDYTIKFANYLKAELQKYGYIVIMTRTGNSGPTLAQRTKLANSKNADIFISLHHNAAPAVANGGLTIYPAVKGNGNKVSQMESQKLAAYFNKAYSNSSMKNLGTYKDVNISGGSLYVLSATKMPSILTEIGFMTNKKDLALIKSPAFQKQMAKSFAFQVYNYINGK